MGSEKKEWEVPFQRDLSSKENCFDYLKGIQQIVYVYLRSFAHFEINAIINLRSAMEESRLLINLVFALAAATIAAAIAVRLKQSAILGYILAGVLIGPYTPGFVGDAAAVESLADIGVVLLMFAIGMQLPPRELLGLGRIATVGGLLQVAVTVGIGYFAGLAVGFRPVEAFLLGAVVSICSGVVVAKLLSESGEVGSVHGRIALAWSSVQDLSTILLVVLLSVLVSGKSAQGMFWAVGKALAFLVLLVPVGAFVLPRFFAFIAALRSREVFVISVAAIALGVAYVSTHFGLALALGAFAAGVIVSESDLSHHILGEVIPTRDLFAGLFFVSVGMLVQPQFVLSHWPLVLLVLVLTVIARWVVTSVITISFRYPPRVAVLVGATMAQSGEFSFLLARLGQQSGSIGADAFNAMLAGTAVSIVLAPAVLHAGRWLGKEAERRLSRSYLPPAPEDNVPLPKGHAVICGYGRVGSTIGEALRSFDIPVWVVDQNLELVKQLHETGIPAFVGGADNRPILERLNLHQACVFVIAIPDALVTRQLVDYLRGHVPSLDIVARTHSDSEQAELQRRGVGEAVVGERELAVEMARFSLARCAVGEQQVNAWLRHLRLQQTKAAATDT